MRVLVILLVLAALFWAVTLWRAARHEARAEAAFPPTGQFLEIDGTRVHAVVSGSGPDVVLIHGSSGSTRDMTFRLAPALADRFRVIALDRPGLGYTDRIGQGGASIAQQADLLRRAAQELGAERPIVLGHSYGGAVALAWAVNHPDALSALVPVASPSHPWDTPLDPLYRVTSSAPGSAVVIPMLTAYVPDSYVESTLASVFDPQDVPEGYAAHFGPGLSLRRTAMRANARQRANLLAEIEALHGRYGDIAVPTEIVHGTADTTVGLSIHSQPLLAAVPGAVLTRLEGIGHMAHQVEPDAVAAAVDRAAARAGLR
ncbi:Pimeloyl-ACP methyl ester carboxylesterase [Cribrihabitans marinus]|uniref:Pimeloyl-ACP methyl ester carboxylesterase n=1 Tax=Cribrihabitans marinus TaxID=1227549 RepID=A0A1H6VZI2_9RHOB|nr:alpha/beta hydrolase [Cribrihabitans marinus]GGH25533.1 hydrolase or acyltransferase (alpha/beta hydrolase) [Cribrihabitans marinus]SEJ05445.1 Pimeloyl-ACP methyl ester carboxylesterase [Cribrihabitans marinus]